MAAVRIISESTVRPANPAPAPRLLELTPWDLQLLLVDYIQKGLLFLPNPTHQNGAVVMDKTTSARIHRLQTTLSRALDFFPPLAGRLTSSKSHDGATTFSLDCSGGPGALFVHAAADGITAADILASACTPTVVNSFFPLNGVLNYEGTSEPLLAVQATELAGGGLFLACSLNHSVADGSTFWNFFNSWSEIARNPTTVTISEMPVFDRDRRMRCFAPIPDFPYDGENPVPPFDQPAQLLERVFNFSREKIAMLKERANGEGRISSLQAILAHLWRAVTRCRRLSPDQEVVYRLVVGARARLRPPLPEGYFGNALVLAAATARAGDLEEGGLGFAAAEINKMVAAQTGEGMGKFLEEWAREPRLMRLGSLVSNALVTGSSPRFNVYGNDFGWGRPAAVRSGIANKFDGKMTVFAGAEEGSVDIEACLLPETLAAMAEDPEFMEAVTV